MNFEISLLSACFENTTQRNSRLGSRSRQTTRLLFTAFLAQNSPLWVWRFLFYSCVHFCTIYTRGFFFSLLLLSEFFVIQPQSGLVRGSMRGSTVVKSTCHDSNSTLMYAVDHNSWYCSSNLSPQWTSACSLDSLDLSRRFSSCLWTWQYSLSPPGRLSHKRAHHQLHPHQLAFAA